MTDPTAATPRLVRGILRKLRLRRAYDHCVQVAARISGVAPKRITPEQEERLRLMFMQMQPVFEKYAPKNRTNFLSYSYCLYKFTELLGYTEFMPYFSLLKGRDKLAKQDLIFSKICAELDWEFISSV